MRKRFKIPLIIVGIILIISIFIGVGYLFYDKIFSKDAVVLVDGNLSINYINGNVFNQSNNQELNFSVTNNSNSPVYFYISLTKAEGNANYELTGSNMDVKNKLVAGVISSYIEIKGRATEKFKIVFTSDNDYNGELEVKTEAKDYETFGDLIIKNNPTKDKTITNIGDVSTTNEGLIKDHDDAGTTYYFRGKNDHNFVSFAGILWRIVRINGDGSVRLISNSAISSNSQYYDDTTDGYTYSSSIIKYTLDKYYNDTLNEYAEYIATLNYCNDVLETETDTFASYNRIYVDHIYTFNCLSEKVQAKIGLLTIDEAIMAGLSSSSGNQNTYLYNGALTGPYFLMSSAIKNANGYFPFAINNDGSILTNLSGKTSTLVRPVINIAKTVSAQGKGTIEDPYQLVILDSK